MNDTGPSTESANPVNLPNSGSNLSTAEAAVHSCLVVLTGNPNSGKTTLFNALTGLRAKVGNYAGVTVERKEGRIRAMPNDVSATLLDLPGTYSLSPRSLDERISRDVLFHRLDEVAAPDIVVVVVDASNLERNLYYTTQVIELGYPTLIALNMIDVAVENGHQIDARQLSALLGVPVLPMSANDGHGVEALRRSIVDLARNHSSSARPHRFCVLPALYDREIKSITVRSGRAERDSLAGARSDAEALLVLTDEAALASHRYPEELKQAVFAARRRLEDAGVDWRGGVIEARYARASEIYRATVVETQPDRESFSDRLDGVLTHKVWGVLIFVVVMALMIQSIFTFAQIPMDAIKGVVGWLADTVSAGLGPGDLNSLLANGVIKGVGAVVVFLPQICLLFLFISLLEDTGYMARAAFLMDRVMSKVGLHGKSFIPMLSSFACAIPGIMATRTIESPKDRLVTILVAPLMSCSARLPVYTLLIAACIPNQPVLGIFKLPGLTMLSMYLLGISVALAMAWTFKKTLLKGETPLLIMELPPYKRPLLRVVIRHMWDRSKLFLRRAGTVILGINILLWFLATYPKSADIRRHYESERNKILSAAGIRSDDANTADSDRKRQLEAIDELNKEEASANLIHSFAGQMGHWIEPVIAPLGFDWKMGIGIVASFAAREVFVSTMSVVYNVGNAADSETNSTGLAETMRDQKRADGSPVYTPLVAVTLMVFYVFALQCVSTVAVVRRETNSWKWPLFQWVYMGILAWVLAFATVQGGRFLGFH